MNKAKIERLILTSFIIFAFMIGYQIGVNDERIRFCDANDSIYSNYEGADGCLRYHGEFCRDIFQGGIYEIEDGVLEIE